MFIKLLVYNSALQTEDDAAFAYLDIWQIGTFSSIATNEDIGTEFEYNDGYKLLRFVALSYDGDGFQALINEARQNPACLVPEYVGMATGFHGGQNKIERRA